MKLFTKKSRYAWLAMVVTASLLGGGYAAQAASAEHDKGIVDGYYGDSYRSYWKDKGISNGKGSDENTYTFQEDTVIKPNASEGTYHTSGSQTYNFSGIFKSSPEDTTTTIDMNGHRLDVEMNYDNPGGTRPAYLNLYGIGVTSGNLVIKNVGGMDLSGNGSYMTNTSKITGIYVAGLKNPDEGYAKLTIENKEGWDNAIKFHASDSGAAQIGNGGIYVWKSTGTANLSITGLVDIDTGSTPALTVLAGYGGPESSGYSGSAETNVTIGGGRFKSTGTALSLVGGYTSINSRYNGSTLVENDSKQDVQIDGDIDVKNAVQGYSPVDNGRLTLALNTKDSYLNGTIYNHSGESAVGKSYRADTYVAVKNGATWTNKAAGSSHVSDLTQFMGGDSQAQTGYIFQKDSSKLNLGNYSGFTTIFYEHDNDGTKTSDYTAGDVTINTAKGGSNITLVTSNVDTNNEDTVKAALNALAGKLYYNGAKTGENALDGTVAIADGLTSSSKYLKTSQLFFDETTGQGTTTSSGGQTVTDFTATLTGNKDTDTAYAKAGVIGEDGSYTFDKATTITTNGSNAIDANGKVTIKADKTLTVSSKGAKANTVFVGDKGTQLDIEAGKLIASVDSNGDASQVTAIDAGVVQGDTKILNITGDVEATAKNTAANGGEAYAIQAKRGIITINGNVKANVDGGKGGYDNTSVGAIMAYGAKYTGYSGKITINGDVDITANGNGLISNGNGATLTVNGGGTIVTTDTPGLGFAAIRANNGTVNLNAAFDKDGNMTGGLGKDVVLKGNVAATDGTSDGTKSVIHLALDTAKSSV